MKRYKVLYIDSDNAMGECFMKAYSKAEVRSVCQFNDWELVDCFQVFNFK